MKTTLFICTAVCSFATAGAQNNNRLMEVFGKRYHYYIDMGDQTAIAFKMTYWIDKAGNGYHISETDTLVKQANGQYAGRITRIEPETDKLYLHFRDNSGGPPLKKAVIQPVTKLETANWQLNNGYWYSNFTKLSDAVNTQFPAYHYSFREAIPYWKQFSNTNMPYHDFFAFADALLKKMQDSITAVHSRHTRTMQYMVDNMATIAYTALKDSLAELPGTKDYNSRYFHQVITAVCNIRPEWFFSLAEDLPKAKSTIFYLGASNKATARRLMEVNTHSPAKKEFAKELRWEKGFKIKTIALYGVLLGLDIYALVQ